MRRRTFDDVSVGLLVVLYTMALSSNAHAYLDPGTGSYLFQLLIAGSVGAFFALKVFWRNIATAVTGFLGRKRGDETTDEE